MREKITQSKPNLPPAPGRTTVEVKSGTHENDRRRSPKRKLLVGAGVVSAAGVTAAVVALLPHAEKTVNGRATADPQDGSKPATTAPQLPGAQAPSSSVESAPKTTTKAPLAPISEVCELPINFIEEATGHSGLDPDLGKDPRALYKGEGPYDLPGAPKTISACTYEIANDSGSATRVSISVYSSSYADAIRNNPDAASLPPQYKPRPAHVDPGSGVVDATWIPPLYTLEEKVSDREFVDVAIINDSALTSNQVESNAATLASVVGRSFVLGN